MRTHTWARVLEPKRPSFVTETALGNLVNSSAVIALQRESCMGIGDTPACALGTHALCSAHGKRQRKICTADVMKENCIARVEEWCQPLRTTRASALPIALCTEHEPELTTTEFHSFNSTFAAYGNVYCL